MRALIIESGGNIIIDIASLGALLFLIIFSIVGIYVGSKQNKLVVKILFIISLILSVFNFLNQAVSFYVTYFK